MAQLVYKFKNTDGQSVKISGSIYGLGIFYVSVEYKGRCVNQMGTSQRGTIESCLDKLGIEYEVSIEDDGEPDADT